MMKKRVVSILNEIRQYTFDFYVHHDTIFKLTEKYNPQILNKVISRHSNHSRSIEETEDQYEKQSKY